MGGMSIWRVTRHLIRCCISSSTVLFTVIPEATVKEKTDGARTVKIQ